MGFLEIKKLWEIFQTHENKNIKQDTPNFRLMMMMMSHRRTRRNEIWARKIIKSPKQLIFQLRVKWEFVIRSAEKCFHGSTSLITYALNFPFSFHLGHLEHLRFPFFENSNFHLFELSCSITIKKHEQREWKLFFCLLGQRKVKNEFSIFNARLCYFSTMIKYWQSISLMDVMLENSNNDEKFSVHQQVR